MMARGSTAGCAALLQIRYGRGVDIRRGAAQRALAGLLVPPRRAGGEEAIEPSCASCRSGPHPGSRPVSGLRAGGGGRFRAGASCWTRGDGGQRCARHAGIPARRGGVPVVPDDAAERLAVAGHGFVAVSGTGYQVREATH